MSDVLACACAMLQDGHLPANSDHHSALPAVLHLRLVLQAAEAAGHGVRARARTWGRGSHYEHDVRRVRRAVPHRAALPGAPRALPAQPAAPHARPLPASGCSRCSRYVALHYAPPSSLTCVVRWLKRLLDTSPTCLCPCQCPSTCPRPCRCPRVCAITCVVA